PVSSQMITSSSPSTATATAAIHTLSLHDALPILVAHLRALIRAGRSRTWIARATGVPEATIHRLLAGQSTITRHNAYRLQPVDGDRKSTRLNSSHVKNSYAVFCLKKKNKKVIDKF